MKNWYIANSTGIVPFNHKILSFIIYLIIDLIIYSISYWYRVHRPLYHWWFSAKVKLSFVTFFLMPCWKFHILFTCHSLTVVKDHQKQICFCLVLMQEQIYFLAQYWLIAQNYYLPSPSHGILGLLNYSWSILSCWTEICLKDMLSEG